jgi:hypothetical protein
MLVKTSTRFRRVCGGAGERAAQGGQRGRAMRRKDARRAAPYSDDKIRVFGARVASKRPQID